MKLYNNHGAAIRTPEIETPLSAAFKEVWNFVEANDINPREAELFCINILQGRFAEAILRAALQKSRKERGGPDNS